MSITQSNSHFEFQGFGSPHFTQVPDEAIDQLMPRLSGAEFKVLMYIIRRTYGFKKSADDISLSQMVEGIRTKDGRQLDSGTGLSKPSVTAAVKGLVEQRIIVASRNQSAERGYEATTYHLRFQDPLLKNLTSPPSQEILPPLVKKFDIQQTEIQQTVEPLGLAASAANPYPEVPPSKFRKATPENLPSGTIPEGTSDATPRRTTQPHGFTPIGSVLPTPSGIPTVRGRAGQATRRVQTETPAAAFHPTGRADGDLPRQVQPTAPGAAQRSQVPDVSPEPKRRQNRTSARQVSQPEADSQLPAPSTSLAEQERRATEHSSTPAEAAPSQPATTDTTAAETAVLSGSSARQNTSAGRAPRRRAARPTPQPAPDLAQEQAAEERPIVLAYIRDYATEFHDQASLKSSVTRAHRLFTDSGLPMEQWVSKLYEAHRVTRERSAAIGYQGQGKKRSSETSSGLTNKMPYFFELLTCVLGLHDHPAGKHPMPFSEREFHRRRTGSGGHASTSRSAAEAVERGSPAAQPAQARRPSSSPTQPRPGHAPLPAATEPTSLWNAVLAELRGTVTGPLFATYLADTTAHAIQDGRLVVTAPTDFAATWLSTKLRPVAHQVLQRITGIAAGIEFRSAEQASRPPAPSSPLQSPAGGAGTPATKRSPTAPPPLLAQGLTSQVEPVP